MQQLEHTLGHLVRLGRVVAKSAWLRFRLRRKLRPLPCSFAPHRTRGLRRWASAGTPIGTTMLPQAGRLLRRFMQALIAAAAAHPEVPGSPGPRRRKVRLAPFPPAAKTAPAPLLLRSPPNPRLTPLGFGGDPDWDGHAAPGGRTVLRRLMQALIAAAGARPGALGSPGPAWPGRTGSGCYSWCKPSSRRPRLCRGWWIRHPGCSLP